MSPEAEAAEGHLPTADEVVASLDELVQAPRPRTRRSRVKAETFGLDGEATPDEVLDSLAAAIGGLDAPVTPEAVEPAETEVEPAAGH